MIQRSKDDMSKAVLNWKPTEKRPQGQPSKDGWMLQKTLIQEWREIVQDQEKRTRIMCDGGENSQRVLKVRKREKEEED